MPASLIRSGTNRTIPTYAHETFDLGVPPTTRTRPHSTAQPPRSSDLARLLDYFGWLPAEITRAVPESVINAIASMVCHAHRMGRKEAHNYLQQFVLEQMRVPDWPHYPMNAKGSGISVLPAGLSPRVGRHLQLTICHD